MKDTKWNTPEAIEAWAEDTLKESNLSDMSRTAAIYNVLEGIRSGDLWRGEVSDKWRDMGYTVKDIPGLFP